MKQTEVYVVTTTTGEVVTVFNEEPSPELATAAVVVYYKAQLPELSMTAAEIVNAAKKHKISKVSMNKIKANTKYPKLAQEFVASDDVLSIISVDIVGSAWYSSDALRMHAQAAIRTTGYNVGAFDIVGITSTRSETIVSGRLFVDCNLIDRVNESNKVMIINTCDVTVKLYPRSNLRA